MPVDFAARRKEVEDQGLLSTGDYLKLKEGPNKIRLMSECLAHPSVFKGQRTFKWLCYVLDRRDSKIKPFFMGHTIYKQLEALQLSEDYAFNEVPMPYDITIAATGAGTKEAKYTVIPARHETPLSKAEVDLLMSAKPLKELQERLKEKKAKEAETAPDFPKPLDDLDDEVPF